MARSTTGKIHHKRSKRILKDVKGFIGGRSKLFRTAKDARRRALQNSYIHRKLKKRDFRALWIVRISAAAKMNNYSYSRFISDLAASNVIINRKILADLAVTDINAFNKIIEKVKR